jgi:hypothetical protein
VTCSDHDGRNRRHYPAVGGTLRAGCSAAGSGSPALYFVAVGGTQVGVHFDAVGGNHSPKCAVVAVDGDDVDEVTADHAAGGNC